MYSKDSTPQYKFLAVGVECKTEGTFYRVRLCKRLGRKTIGLGTDYLVALNAAQAIDRQIEEWVNNNREIDLDTLKILAKKFQEDAKPKSEKYLRLVEKDDIQQVWANYVEFHVACETWKSTYIASDIKMITDLLARCPYQKLEDKNNILLWIMEDGERKPSTSKKRFMMLVAAIDWAAKRGDIPRIWGIEYRDLYDTLKTQIKGSKKKKKQAEIDPEKDIKVFEVEQVYAILDALKTERFSRFKGKHRQYWAFAYFCWLTGCRPSEAIALTWGDVDFRRNKILFNKADVEVSGTVYNNSGTKTEDYRYFPLSSESLRELLESLPSRGKNERVFVNDKGKPISQPAFRGVWETVISKLGMEYRIPYQLRHTMISYHANNDYPLHKLAEIVGNSETVIRKHYLHIDIDRICLPDVIKPN